MSCRRVLAWLAGCETNVRCSASPLNGEAALLWDRDQVEYKKKVLTRHLEPVELENGA